MPIDHDHNDPTESWGRWQGMQWLPDEDSNLEPTD
jgi:hypothetical protein